MVTDVPRHKRSWGPGGWKGIGELSRMFNALFNKDSVVALQILLFLFERS